MSATIGTSGGTSETSLETSSAEASGSSSDGGDPLCDCEPDEVCFGFEPGLCSDLKVSCVPRPRACGEQPTCDAACVEALCGRGAFCQSSCPGVPREAIMCVPPNVLPCDPLVQDCAPGEKCTVLSASAYMLTRCVSLDPNPVSTGESCLADAHSGADTCDIGDICWNVDAQTQMGVCVPRCAAGPNEPTCPEGACVQVEALPVCAPHCDDEPCTTGNACVPHGETSVCVPAV